MKFVEICDKIIEYAIYSLFLLVPLVFSGDTSELFELNKMWFAFGVTAIIVAAWGTKMVLEKKIHIQRTPFDIPVLLFLLSQIISTVISLDPQVSWWGYYSRFNGGLLSTLCYVFLYYAIVTNFSIKQAVRSLQVLLLSGFLAALWGFPSHFGADPTCLVFRGTLDTTCWTDAFQPTIRAFSTLGQPAWYAAFLAAIIPVAMAFSLTATRVKMWGYVALSVFLYLNLIFSDTRAGFLAFWAGHLVFWLGVYIRHALGNVISKKMYFKAFALFTGAFILCSFLFGSPVGTLSRFSLPNLITKSAPAPKPEVTFSGTPAPKTVSPQILVTDSSNIRLLVWKGAIDAWESSPIFGTGVETFAFAYYKHKSPEHNLTSEWDYLYNKAHNEYLNYLTTTGILGLGSYLAMIVIFLGYTAQKMALQAFKKHENKKDTLEEHENALLILGIVGGYVTILISNFFGFSVVIMNLCLFLFPAIALLLGEALHPHKSLTYAFGQTSAHKDISGLQWTLIGLLAVFAVWMNIGLLVYRYADIEYALGNNLDKTGNFQEAYQHLTNAVQTIPSEAVYKDEYAINLAANAANLFAQKENDKGSELAKKAMEYSNQVIAEHPNNVVYWKNRVRMYYTLASVNQTDAQMLYQEALHAIDTARTLAPNDAKIAYNQGVLYGQTGQIDKGIQILNETIKLKSNYTDAYVALGLFYHQASVDKNGTVVNAVYQKKAIEIYEYILKNIDPQNKDVQDNLKQWKKV